MEENFFIWFQDILQIPIINIPIVFSYFLKIYIEGVSGQTFTLFRPPTETGGGDAVYHSMLEAGNNSIIMFVS